MAQPVVSTMLVVQPIVSTTGLTRYHEILIRIKMVDGKLIFQIPSYPLLVRQDYFLHWISLL